MKAVTWTQVAQYFVLIIAYLIPVFWMSDASDYGLIPQLAHFIRFCVFRSWKPSIVWEHFSQQPEHRQQLASLQR